MRKISSITINCDGEFLSHAVGVAGNYATLCQMDGDDLAINQSVVGKNELINCPACCAIWLHAQSYHLSQFDKKVMAKL